MKIEIHKAERKMPQRGMVLDLFSVREKIGKPKKIQGQANIHSSGSMYINDLSGDKLLYDVFVIAIVTWNGADGKAMGMSVVGVPMLEGQVYVYDIVF